MSERGRKDDKRKRQGIVPLRAPKKKAKACPECGGYGLIPETPCQLRHCCQRCHGTGKIEEGGDEDAE